LGHFAREIALNDDYLGQFFLDNKVLWMTLGQLFEILINVHMFTYLQQSNMYIASGAKSTFGPI